MRYRKSMVTVLIFSSIFSVYLGTANINLKFDKFIHFSVFYLMTLIFYYCFDTKNTAQLKIVTFAVCSLGAGIGSELFQSLLPYRTFDYYDILMNITGSASGLASSELYTRYMVRRRRMKRLELIKSIGEEAEILAENYERNSGSYSGYSNEYDSDTRTNSFDYYSEDLESRHGASDSIELKNVPPIALNDVPGFEQGFEQV